MGWVGRILAAESRYEETEAQPLRFPVSRVDRPQQSHKPLPPHPRPIGELICTPSRYKTIEFCEVGVNAVPNAIITRAVLPIIWRLESSTSPLEACSSPITGDALESSTSPSKAWPGSMSAMPLSPQLPLQKPFLAQCRPCQLKPNQKNLTLNLRKSCVTCVIRLNLRNMHITV